MHRLYLNVPYSQKDEAKRLGAKWDGTVKKWYCDTRVAYKSIEGYFPFMRWILGDKNEVFIARKNLYILESKKTCWRCKKQTKVVALGVRLFVNFEEDDGEIYIDDGYYYEHVGELQVICLAWVDNEEQIPPVLLKHLKENYNVKMAYSRTAGKCFANHCEHCGSIQGNYYLFSETDSPFMLEGISPGKFKEKIENLLLLDIAISDDLILDWTIYDWFEIPIYGYIKIYDEFPLDGERRIYDYPSLFCKGYE